MFFKLYKWYQIAQSVANITNVFQYSALVAELRILYIVFRNNVSIVPTIAEMEDYKNRIKYLQSMVSV